jgi:putative transposase
VSLLFIVIAHLLVTLARLARPGGVRAAAAESLAVKHQILIVKRSRRRSPNLTRSDRFILGFCTLLVSLGRLGKMAVILKSSTFLRLHRALVKRKYRLLYSSGPCRRPGPEGPSGGDVSWGRRCSCVGSRPQAHFMRFKKTGAADHNEPDFCPGSNWL